MTITKDFGDRTQEAQIVVQVIQKHVWDHPQIRSRVYHVQYGYETHIPDEIRQKLRHIRTDTSRYIRFAPDFFVLDQVNPDRMYLLEYKSTRTPLYSQQRIDYLAAQARIPRLDWQSIGQWEAMAYDNYKALQDIGVRVAVLNYCAYHPRKVVCDFVESAQEIGRYEVVTDTQTGSKTPFVNIDLRNLRSLAEFLRDEHGIDWAIARSVYIDAVGILQKEMPIAHHPRSPFKGEVQFQPDWKPYTNCR